MVGDIKSESPGDFMSESVGDFVGIGSRWADGGGRRSGPNSGSFLGDTGAGRP